MKGIKLYIKIFEKLIYKYIFFLVLELEAEENVRIELELGLNKIQSHEF